VSNLPGGVTLMTQRIGVTLAENLHTPSDGWVHEGDDASEHLHRAYGVYNEVEQSITLDVSLGFERQRETFLHENLHAMCAMTQLDTLAEAQMPGFSEHMVSALAPVLLAWMRDNPHVVAYLQEEQ
jgi:hypothetical protein